jgi:ATP-dependent Lon protease
LGFVRLQDDQGSCKVAIPIAFPEANRKDFAELPDYLKDGLEVHFAREFKDVYKVAFGKG